MELIIEIPNYKIEKTLYKSRNYVLFSAKRISDKKKVIIKTPHNNDKDSISVLRLHNEYNIGHEIKHKNILKLLSFEDLNGIQIITKEYFNGIKLGDFIS